MKFLYQQYLALVTFVMVCLAAFLPQSVLAQIPTTTPTVVTDAIDDAYAFIGDAGVLFLGVIAVLALIKWIRGVLF